VVFTLFLLTASVAAATGASARPAPPIDATRGHSHHDPSGAASSGVDLTVWLLTAVVIAFTIAVVAGVATALRHRRPPVVGSAVD
jgi:hypothetical protein